MTIVADSPAGLGPSAGRPAGSAQQLAARLEDPRVAASLDTLLDHADLLAVIVSGLDAALTRSPTMMVALSQGLEDARKLSGESLPDPSELTRLAQGLSTLVGPLTEMLPTLEALMKSDLADPRVIDTASMASRAVVAGAEQARREQPEISGVFALMRALKDPDVSRGLGFVVAVAKAFGQQLRGTGQTPRAT